MPARNWRCPRSPDANSRSPCAPIPSGRSGHRVGYGAGYYDMTIMGLRARKPVVAVGIAFAAQEIARVPTTARDAPLDLVLTEHEIIDCRAT